MNHPTLLPHLGLLAVLLLTACTGSTTPPTVMQGTTRLAPGSAAPSSATCDSTHTASCGGGQCCGTGDSCVISLMGSGGGFFCTTCPADFPAACSKTTCCRTAAVCDTNFRHSTFGSCLCPTGETLCGDACCPAGSICDGGVCLSCPASAPNLCGNECRSTSCDEPGGGECPTDTRACPDGASCCPLGSRCCEGGGCCPPSAPYLGGGRCYTSFNDCHNAGNNRCASCQG
jgi:hypothetical protein